MARKVSEELKFASGIVEFLFRVVLRCTPVFTCVVATVLNIYSSISYLSYLQSILLENSQFPPASLYVTAQGGLCSTKNEKHHC